MRALTSLLISARTPNKENIEMLLKVRLRRWEQPYKIDSTAVEVSWGQWDKLRLSRRGLFCTIVATIVSVRVVQSYIFKLCTFRNKQYPVEIEVQREISIVRSWVQLLTRVCIPTSVTKLVKPRSIVCSLGQYWVIVVISASAKSSICTYNWESLGVALIRVIRPLAVTRSQCIIYSVCSSGHFPARAVIPRSFKHSNNYRY